MDVPRKNDGPSQGPNLITRAIVAITRFNVALGSASGISTMLMMLVIVPDVLMRKFLGTTIPAASEISVLLLVGKIFLGLPGAQASEANFRVSVVSDALGPSFKRWLKVIMLALSSGVLAVLASQSIGEAVNSTLRDEISFGVVAFPVWPSKIIIGIGFGLLTVQLIVDAVRTAFDISVWALEGRNTFKG